MEIRFSEHALLKAGCPLSMEDEALNVIEPLYRAVAFTNAAGRSVRFTLPGATTEQHDSVIRALLTLDPDATVRTARAVYEGLDDFEAQVKARVK